MCILVVAPPPPPVWSVAQKANARMLLHSLHWLRTWVVCVVALAIASSTSAMLFVSHVEQPTPTMDMQTETVRSPTALVKCSLMSRM
jgi:hypothetical protein